jgi:hypothetical protein
VRSGHRRARELATVLGATSALCLWGACGAFSLHDVVSEPDGSVTDAPTGDGGDGGGSVDDSGESGPPPCDGSCSCLPQTVLSNGNGPIVAFQIDATNAYWLAKVGGKNPVVYNIPLVPDGGMLVPVAPSFSYTGVGSGMGLDSHYVYSAQASSPAYLARVPLAGGTMTPFSPALPSVTSLQVGPDGLYWADKTSDVCTASLTGVLPPGDSGCGGGALSPGPADAASSPYNSLALADASVYLAVYSTGEIWRARTTDGQKTLLVVSDAHNTFRPMVASDTDLFFAQKVPNDGGAIVHLAVEGGDASTLVTTDQVMALTFDDTNVYYVAGAQIAKVPRDGGVPTVLGCAVAPNVQPAFIAVDGMWVYWADANDGLVWRAPK